MDVTRNVPNVSAIYSLRSQTLGFNKIRTPNYINKCESLISNFIGICEFINFLS
jgi:hypothetical protein